MSDRTGPTRRDFLKALGLSSAGAATAACSPPDTADQLIPYLVQPDEILPGTNTAYAGVLTEGGPEPLGLHTWTREGRAIMLEGNPDFPTNQGRVSALAQSALQDLYDPDRIRRPRRATGESGEDGDDDPGDGWDNVGWEDAIAAAGEAVGTGATVLLTRPATATRATLYRAWAEATGAEHVAWESLHHAALRRAHQIAFGRDEIPDYRIHEADRIVSFGADFLGTWVAPVQLAGRFAEARAVDEDRFARFTFVGPRLSLTGTNADDWIPARAGREGLVALATAREVARIRGEAAGLPEGALDRFSPGWAAERTGAPEERIRELAAGIAEADRPIALPPGPGSADSAATDAHLAVAILNRVAGALNETVVFGAGPVRGRSATMAEMRDLIERMGAGAVDTLIVAGPNPLYDLPASAGVAEALAEVPDVFSLNPHPDETTLAAGWNLPSHHELESWGDAEVRPGDFALGQPVMRPIFETRQREDILMQIAAAAGGATGAGGENGGGQAAAEAIFGAPDFATYLQNEWREGREENRFANGAGGSGAGTGVVAGVGGRARGAETNGAGADGAGAAQQEGELDFEEWWRISLQRGGRYSEAAPEGEDVELSSEAATRDFTWHEGTGEDTFDLVVYPTVQFYDGRGANRGWMQEFRDPVTHVVWGSWVEMHPETAEPMGLAQGDLVEVRSAAGTIRAPLYLYRGIRPDTVAIPMGQGHDAYGRQAEGRGVNPLDLLPAAEDAESGGLSLAGTRVAVIATGEEGRLISLQGHDSDEGREIADLMELGEAREAVDAHEVDLAEMVKAAWDSDPQSPYRWGMTIDLNACSGCGACVTACYAENNLAVVGEEQCARGREMSWLRVERYFEETADGGFQTVHEPMLCQHCGDAPCEPVCPVYATYHNPEGLNVQVYNRCVGTRYCSNNCPYKVRRFNWFSYEFPYPLNLQLNPDVTVRDKGVMEKCTFCVQRINRARVEAKEEGRLIEDGEVRTACQSACPTGAIVFGNLKDPTSRVSQIAKGARSYHVLEELNTRPAVTYLKDVTHAELAAANGHGGEDDHGAASDHEGENGAGGNSAGGNGAGANGAGPAEHE